MMPTLDCDLILYSPSTIRKKLVYSFARDLHWRPVSSKKSSQPQRHKSTFGFEERNFQMQQRSPAPNIYCIPSSFAGQGEKGFSFGFNNAEKSRKPQLRSGHRPVTPGPGAYEITFRTGQYSQKYSIRNRTPIVEERDRRIPGPGAYNLQEALSTRRVLPIDVVRSSTSPRFRNPSRIPPGPGSYNTTIPDTSRCTPSYTNKYYQ